jgi:hypothetical protein
VIKLILAILKNTTTQATLGLLGLIFAVFSIYLTFNYSKKTDITYQLVSDSYVVEINEKVNKLDVLYDGKSIKDSNQKLRLITFKVSNSGENTIRIGDYDEKLPLGFSIDHGEIVEAPSISGNKPYFPSKLNPKLVSKSLVHFSPAILEPNDYFIVSSLILVSETTPIKITPLGVIAGLSLGAPAFLDIPKTAGRAPIYVGAFAGSWPLQVVRLFVYSFGTFIVLLVAVALISLPRYYFCYKENIKVRKVRIGIANEYIRSRSKQKTRTLEYMFREFTDRLVFYHVSPGEVESLVDLHELVRNRESYFQALDGIPNEKLMQILPFVKESRQWERILDYCSVKGSIEVEREFVKEIDSELCAYLNYLKQRGYDPTSDLRHQCSRKIFLLMACESEPDFHWVGK